MTARAREAAHCDPENATRLLELAWLLIANAGNGDWTTESAEWQRVAATWRDGYHAFTGARTIEVPRLEADAIDVRKFVELADLVREYLDERNVPVIGDGRSWEPQKRRHARIVELLEDLR